MGCGEIYENMIGEEVICGTFNDAGNRRMCKKCADIKDAISEKRGEK